MILSRFIITAIVLVIAFENPEAFEAYEATFPAKEKKVMEGQLVDDCTKNPNE